MNKRNLSPNEHEILSRLLATSFPGNRELNEQLVGCEALPTGDNDNYGSIHLFPRAKVAAPVLRRVPVEGLGKDASNGEVDILLHVTDGLLHELEIVKLDGSPLQGEIDPKSIEVIINE